MTVRLLVAISDSAKRRQLVNAFADDDDITIVGIGPDLSQAFLSSADAPSAGLVTVDLSSPAAAESRFWTTLHVMYPAARIMALAEPWMDEPVLHAALHAGTHCFVVWSDPPERLREAARAAHEGRRFYSTPWLIAAAQRLIRDLETGLIRATLVRPKRSRERRAAKLDLTALESDVLSYLARNAGKVVSPAELIREVWKYDAAAGDIANQVNCCVKRLRRKLGASHRGEIQTIYGRGYRFTRTTASGKN